MSGLYLVLLLHLGLILLPTSARPSSPGARRLLHRPDDALDLHPGMPPASLIRAEVPASEGDRAALVEIYQSTNGPGWLNSSGWLEGDPCLDAWLGVGCGEDGRVATLGAGGSLRSNNMTGQLPPDINDLTALISLDLTLNPIGGGLPPIGDLRDLQILSLQVNNFEGPLPPLDNLTSLVQVSLLQNSFSGSLPPLTNFTDLQELILGSNMFTGTVPSSYSNLTSLINLDLSSNALSGALPPLDNLHDLQQLRLYDNMFTGTVPSSYSNLTSLTILSLSSNALSGALPPLESLHDLQYLNLRDNMFTGTVPSSYSNLTSLTTLSLSSNTLSGALPPLNNFTDLQSLKLYNNKFTGTVPSSYSNLTSLTILDLSSNALSGALPPLDSLHDLQELWLYDNKFTGTVPSSYSNLTSLTKLSLHSNALSGALPPLDSLHDLEYLSLYDNMFTGTVPSSYSNLTSLTSLSLSSNALSGALPPLDSLHDLQDLYLNDNMFTGTVPSSYSNLTSLTTLSLHSNALSGALPPLNNLHDLQYLYLGSNLFTGTVPSSYSNLASLTKLSLHSNALSGALPPLDNLHDLQYLGLYDNMFTGPLPDVANFPDLLIFLAHNNDFSSSLPPSLFSLPKLEAVILSGNSKLTGTLPAVLDAPSLTSLVIEGCDLSGPLPTSISSNLTALYLAGNRLESIIPPLPPTITDVSLAYNELSGFLSDDYFAHTPDLETFDIRHNKIGGSIPSSMSSLEHLADLKTDLNYMSGSLAADMKSWPIFASSDTSSTTSTILFGNIWSCPIEPAIRDHSDDEAHAYACGDSEFVTPILVAAAAFALFAAAVAFTKHENVYRLVCYYSRSKTVVLTDARKLVNVGYSCYKLVAAVLLASIGLSATYWNAHSAFDTQPALLKLSATLKTASDGFILPLLAITTLTLLYYIRWGWGMRFEGRVESELTGSGKPRSWRGTVKLAGLVAYVMATTTGFDFVYVFFVATNPRMSTSTRTLLNALLSQFKSSFLNERWAAKQALKLANPTKRFNYLVFTMSAIMLLNALVVPSVLVLLLDERCFKFYDFWLFGRLQTQAPHDVVVPYTYCGYVDIAGNDDCPNPNYSNDGYVTDYYSTTFEYPWSLSEQCGSAVIQSYSPVVLSELTLSLILQPAMWWLCTDHGDSHASKWAILSAGLFVSLGLPNTVSMFADDIDAGLGGWATLLFAIAVFSTFVLAAWLLKKLAPTAASPSPSWSYLPPVDYLLDLFDYNFDEDRLLGQKETYTWPLQDRFWEHVQGFGSIALDFLGFARGNFASEYDGLIDDAFRGGPEDDNEEDEEEAVPLYRKDRFGRDLPFAYANLVKTTALILTFGLAAPLTAWVGCLGLLARWLTLSYLAERWRRKEDEEGGLVTDAQGLPFRCVVLVVVCVLAFFGTAAVLSGVGGEASAWTWVGLGAMAGVLVAQTWLIGRETVRKAARSAARSSDLREPLLDADDLAAAADNE